MHKVFILLGPTASGKSKLSMKLSKDYPFEIINADLYSIYKGLDIGTAKPSNTDLESTKHYLIDKIEPDKNYNVSKFCSDVSLSIKAIISNNKYPLIVGGTMMYVYQLLNGLTHDYNLIKSDVDLIKYILDKYSYEEIYKTFKSDTSIPVEKINCNDKYRIEKLLERSIANHNRCNQYTGLYDQKDMRINIIFIDIKDRNLLKESISKRTEEMLQRGLVKEVQQLITKYNLTEDSQSMKAIGYKETIDYLNHNIDLNGLADTISLSTQQLAKRQITWKNKFKINFTVDYPQIDYDELSKFVTNSLN
jgi:tRNA dimethylallyltransferase